MPSRPSKSTHETRIELLLDSRLQLEAWLIRTLEGIPTARRQEWLRGLLVSGFIQQRAQTRMVQGRGIDPAGPLPAARVAGTTQEIAFGDYLASALLPEPSSPPRSVSTASLSVATEQGGKPFAGLRKVIGE